VQPRRPLGVALAPEPDVDQGDPFLLCDDTGSRACFFVYVTSPGFPVYAADDLLDPAAWHRVGDSMPDMDPQRWHWAPCVRHVPGLNRPWVMLYSKARGSGPVDGHIEHRIFRADSESPTGPFIDSGEVLTPDLDFAIDPEVHRRADGSTWLYFAQDFVGDEPYGTGIVAAPISADLRHLEQPPAPVARPSADWQVYDEHRSMPWKSIPGIEWLDGTTVRWSTIEGPAALTSPRGAEVLLYSGGNFAGFYGIGRISQDEAGRWVDRTPTPVEALLGPRPDEGLIGPGHCSVLQRDGATYCCYHFRAEPDAPRQFGIVPLRWDPISDLPELIG
jgi:arabinan endo-1,5-alpha-L-arabinosidase